MFKSVLISVQECSNSVQEYTDSVQECSDSVQECSNSVQEYTDSVQECSDSVQECSDSVHSTPHLVVWLLCTQQSKDAGLGRMEVRGRTLKHRAPVGQQL